VNSLFRGETLWYLRDSAKVSSILDNIRTPISSYPSHQSASNLVHLLRFIWTILLPIFIASIIILDDILHLKVSTSKSHSAFPSHRKSLKICLTHNYDTISTFLVFFLHLNHFSRSWNTSRMSFPIFLRLLFSLFIQQVFKWIFNTIKNHHSQFELKKTYFFSRKQENSGPKRPKLWALITFDVGRLWTIWKSLW
jgi:hypothetical protein